MLSIEEKELVDSAFVDFNETLRAARDMANGMTPISGFQESLAALVSAANREDIKPSRALREYVNMVSAFADLAEECEQENEADGTECCCGLIGFNMVVSPVTIVLNAVHCGFEIARGKDMQP
jgi:hypothetical protein